MHQVSLVLIAIALLACAGCASAITLARDGAPVPIDPVRPEYMKGCRFDLVDHLIGQSLKTDNPNATPSCGRASSFSL